jgi:hypothetical protein
MFRAIRAGYDHAKAKRMRYAQFTASTFTLEEMKFDCAGLCPKCSKIMVKAYNYGADDYQRGTYHPFY